MDLLVQLEEKIINALETIELLAMENEELKTEVSELKKQNVGLSTQQSDWETKVSSMLSQFETEVVELQQQQQASENF